MSNFKFKDAQFEEDLKRVENQPEKDSENQDDTTLEMKPGLQKDPESEVNSKDETEPGISLVYMIDSIFGLLVIIIWDIDDDKISLSSKEMKYFEDMERKLGIVIFVNSIYFYSFMLVLTYSKKIMILVRIRRKMKKEEKENPEKKNDIEDAEIVEEEKK